MSDTPIYDYIHKVLRCNCYLSDLGGIECNNCKAKRDLFDLELRNAELTARIAELEAERKQAVEIVADLCGDIDQSQLVGLQFLQAYKRLIAALTEARKDGQRLNKLWAIGRQNQDSDGDWRVCYSKHHTGLREAIDLTPNPPISFWPPDSFPSPKETL